MSNRDETFARLRKAAWNLNPGIATTNDPSCKFQTFANGNGTLVYDEYSTIMEAMPSTTTAEDYLTEIATSPNTAVNFGPFNTINVFYKRTSTPPAIGDIYDIDIIMFDNGSVVLVALSNGFGHATGDAWFDVQTVGCDKYGDHPESGCREFGFEYVGGGVMFYTRGISSPTNWATGLAGSVPQKRGWVSMMNGISNTLTVRGGRPKLNSLAANKWVQTSG